MIQNNLFELTLSKAGELLDVPEALYEEAVAKYEDVTDWLGAEGSDLIKYSPIAYPQGSFRLGTVIKPLNDNDKYDIDFVCRLSLEKSDVTKKELKNMLGKRLKQHEVYSKFLEQKGRCWTLNFSDLFHMDILPTIPNDDEQPHGVWLTDRELHNWQESNPIEFADWFKSRMDQQFQFKKLALAKSRNIQIEEIQDWEVKTPLQRSIQILKRQRDIFFEGKESKPASIIITTLSGMAYTGQDTITDSLIQIISTLENHIKFENDRYIIKSPVSEENFADKWNYDEEKQKSFFSWLNHLKSDVLPILKSKDVEKLNFAIGSNMLKKAMVQDQKKNIFSAELSTIPGLGDLSHRQALAWPTALNFNAQIKAETYVKNKSRKLLSLRSGDSVAKNRKIKFITVTDVPGHYEVKWQVSNTGAEAIGNLRGSFYDCDFKNGRWEDTQYKGTHLVQAFVIQNNKCVAKSDPFEVKIRNSFF